MAVNDEKEAKYRIRPGSTGKKVVYATLNIMMQSAKEQVASQMSVNEIDEEGQLLESYASRLSMPTFAYLRRDGFESEFQNNGLINGQMHETLAKCIYVGQKEVRGN